jgi:hypothetical protein
VVFVDLSWRVKLSDVEGVEVVVFGGEEEDGREGGTPGEGVGFHLELAVESKWGVIELSGKRIKSGPGKREGSKGRQPD